MERKPCQDHVYMEEEHVASILSSFGTWNEQKKRTISSLFSQQPFKLFHAWYRAIALSNSYSAYLVRLCICPWEMIIICTRFHFFTVYQYCQL
jgi:hypothetical protein